LLEKQLLELKDWFKTYIKGFYNNDPSIQAGIGQKEKHTLRVCEKTVRIGLSLDLDSEDIRLAETAALFHDIGRFRQFTVYRTFNDRRSENHALLGVRELKTAGVLSSLAEEEQELILTAVGCHNMFKLPPDLGGRALLFCRLVRDADKLDIMDSFANYYTYNPSPLFESDLPETPGYSAVLVENLIRRQGCSYSDMKNYNDRKLLILSWVYDINFPYALAEIAENRCLEKITRSLPGTGEINEAYNSLRSYIAARLETV